MRAALRHPAVHVLLLGLLVALAILLARGPSSGDARRRVAVTSADLMHLRAAFVRTWQREPTDAELRSQLESFIRQEVLYREALARGYDRDDPVVRQAMQLKMEFLAASQAAQEPPSDAEIEAFFALRRERYRVPAVLDLAQVYLRADGAPAAAEERAARLLQRLRDEEPAPTELAAWECGSERSARTATGPPRTPSWARPSASSPSSWPSRSGCPARATTRAGSSSSTRPARS